MHACTIVARNYLAQAQVLVDSFRRHHPEGTFDVLLIDEPGSARPVVRGAEVVLPDEIGLAPDDLVHMSLIYDLIELATAVKPSLLLHLLGRGYDHAVYFDPDISIERRIEELPGLARDNDLVLTPHLTEPMPRDGGWPSEQSILLSGTYNLGFIAVGGTDEARRMLEWWKVRLLDDCLVRTEHGFFTDQRFIDFVPGLFNHVLVKDPSWNAAYWNLATRPLSRGADGEILISGRPRTFVHFSGYSPALPHLLSKHQGPEPRLRLSELPLLRELCDDYGARLVAAGFLEHQREFRFPFTTHDGVPLDRTTRRLVREHCVRIAAGKPSTLGIHQPGVPLDEWLDTPDPESESPHLSRYLAGVYERRPDVQQAFPGARSGHTKGFYRWVRTHGVAELGVPVERLEGALRREAEAPTSALLSRPADPVEDTAVRGVEVAGYLTADLGLGESARQFVAALEATGAPVSTTTYSRTLSRLGTAWEDRLPAPGTRHDTALVCVNADQLSLFRRDAASDYFRGRYRIGLWFWELAEFPVVMREALDLLDEVWVCSEFNQAVIAAETDKPVRVVPHPAHPPQRSTTRIAEVPDDGTFTFLFVFDHLSVYERKNPAGLVEAFCRAFPEPGRARLVIKSVNGGQREQSQEHLRYASAGRDDIVLVERYLSRAELDGLMYAADCYVSLHRSEGFGQTLAESMAMGKPVIATAYSGSLEFTRPENCLLVPYTMVSVPPGCDPYPTTAKWADPDLDEAARLMREVYGDPALRERLGAAAARTIAEEFSTKALAAVLDAHLTEIWAGKQYDRRRTSKASRPAPPPPPAAPGASRAPWRNRVDGLRGVRQTRSK
jgi:glycosyltransferase involved in cell wall biosynthesis